MTRLGFRGIRVQETNHRSPLGCFNSIKASIMWYVARPSAPLLGEDIGLNMLGIPYMVFFDEIGMLG